MPDTGFKAGLAEAVAAVRAQELQRDAEQLVYSAANRDADAHAVLAPAIEGFPPTEQFPELTEAQTLLAALNR